MVHHHDDYAGPAALTRAYSLLADKRDGLFAQRLEAALTSCHDCRTEANCTEVCPKGISPTRAIKYIQRIALTHRGEAISPEATVAEKEAAAAEVAPPLWPEMDRATFLRHAGVALLGAGVAVTLGSIAAVTAFGLAAGKATDNWMEVLAKLSDLPAGQVTTVLLNYEVKKRHLHASDDQARARLATWLRDHLLQIRLPTSGVYGALGRQVGSIPLRVSWRDV